MHMDRLKIPIEFEKELHEYIRRYKTKFAYNNSDPGDWDSQLEWYYRVMLVNFIIEKHPELSPPQKDEEEE